MKTVRWAMLSGSFLAIAACGSHNHAPVVYGNDPARQARVYHSADEIYREQQVARTQAAPTYQAPTYGQRSVASAPAQLTPVSAIYLDEPSRSGPSPLYVQANATPPAHLHKAKGYIEVQRGDTVYAIARQFSVTPASIIDENDLDAPYALKVGQVLKLPKGSTVVAHDAPSHQTPGQSVARVTRKIAARDQLYTVRRGDTLYSISRKAGVDASTIASANKLPAPYQLDVGRQLVIPQAPAEAFKTAKAQTPSKTDVGEIARNVSYTPPAATPKSMFSWPVRGAVVSEYGSGNLGRRNDGVNIAAPVGAPVRAAADGQVVYRGSELDGFGNLLLVKHQDGFVTAYAHNDSMLVKKGDQIRKGQVIAKVGQTGAVTTPQLHFEIRQELQTVDPVALLGKP